MRTKKILLDMDGVIVDFVRGALRFHNIKTPYSQIRWDFDKVTFPNNVAAFWDPLGYDFWSNLDWSLEGPALYDGLKALVGVDNICICTSPVRTPGCVDGKLEWIRKHIPEMSRQFMVTPTKKFAAHHNTILVDDRNENCIEFSEHGGHSVLVPQPWNAHAALWNGSYSVGHVLDLVKELLNA